MHSSLNGLFIFNFVILTILHMDLNVWHKDALQFMIIEGSVQLNFKILFKLKSLFQIMII